MDKFGKSQSVTRVEDTRFLMGQGRYVDDIAPAGALFAYYFRSPVAHATIKGLNTTEAAAAEGVHLVMTAETLAHEGITEGMSFATMKNRDGTAAAAPRRPFLAEERVRFVGEPVALIVADSLNQAKDAAELIEFDYEELPVHMELSPAGEPLHPQEAPNNRAFDWAIGDGEATHVALEKSHRVVRLEIGDNRIIVNSMEPRGCYAEVVDGRLHLAVNGQGVWGMQDELARVFAVDKETIRVTNPDVGGGFGMKGMPYPEYFTVPLAARLLNRPVRWIGERTESMLSDNAGRDLVTMAEMGFDKDGRITAYRVHNISNLGAYCSNFAQAIQSNLFARVLTGTYDIKTAYLRCEGILTNTTQVDAYRGAGRPEAIYVLERMMDRAARELDMDPFELRRLNFVKEFPYNTVTGETYDVGDFPRVLAHAERLADVPGFAARRSKSEEQGKLRGLGLCYYIESILGDPSEGVQIDFTEDGGALIYVGTQSNGQGHETVFAQFLSDQTGIPADRIRVIQGDSDLIAKGGGTGGSRSVTTQTNVTLTAVAKIVEGFTAFLADEMGVAAEDITFDDERFRAEGSNLTPTLLEGAQMAREAGRTDLLVWKVRDQLPARSFPNGAHLAEVEIDPETGQVTCDRYHVVDDFGNLINPMLAEGQVHGGVAQGLGQALTEHVVYDDQGQLLTATFMDYGMPRADVMPWVVFETEPVPSTANPMGMKGCGEAGTVGAMAAMGNAVQDALWARGIKQVDMPFTPQRVWEMLRNVAVAAE
ncbi:xanthine dehydrogenase family protein molybdopterin-binding subunit [Tropicibacter sp. S64]|uniref:xanthine dehydrogenase family protein molybdopterin-binding subunit n=1 Tax=Tropicibacter sp. S64 TaxID=3415122 RepID=UPI003C7B9B33